MKLKPILIHFFSIAILVATIYLPIQLSYIQDKKLFKVVHTTQLKEDSLLQNVDTSVADKLSIICLAEHGDSDIIMINRQLLGQGTDYKFFIPQLESLESLEQKQIYQDKIIPILLESLNKLYQSNVISNLNLEDGLTLSELSLSTFTNQLDGKNVSFYSIVAYNSLYSISTIIDSDSHLIYKLRIYSNDSQSLFTDESQLVNTWSNYLGISLKPYENVNTAENNYIFEFKKSYFIYSVSIGQAYQINNIDNAQYIFLCNDNNELYIWLKYAQ